jgi:hypothetical protein
MGMLLAHTAATTTPRKAESKVQLARRALEIRVVETESLQADRGEKPPLDIA